MTNPPIQAVQITADKAIVWGLRAWAEPAALGPATTIQILEKGDVPENVHFGPFK